jgi:hypothetical protein
LLSGFKKGSILGCKIKTPSFYQKVFWNRYQENDKNCLLKTYWLWLVDVFLKDEDKWNVYNAIAWEDGPWLYVL